MKHIENIEQLKIQYNHSIRRMKKAEDYFNNKEIPMTKKEKWLDDYTNLAIELSELMYKYYELTGEEMKDENIFNGF